MDSAEPLTKAKLFASHQSGQWTEVGVGVVSIVKEPLPASLFDGGTAGLVAAAGGGGKRGKASDEDAGTKLAARLQIFTLDTPSDLLLSSIVSLDDIYTVQGDTILVWSDETVGSEIACSFLSKEGCDYIFGQISAYQQSERVRRLQDERVPVLADKFLVHPRNLAGILDAALAQNKRFAHYVREDAEYFTRLAQLFRASREKHDAASMELIARIVLTLFQPPYSTEGKIIAQFVENDRIDDSIDIVQYGLGRHDKASGFVGFEERRATFHDPCHLPEALLQRVHVLYSCGYLRDLIPLSLEPADAASYSLLGTFTLRFSVNLLTEIVTSPTILPNAFRTAVEGVQPDPLSPGAPADPAKVAYLYELAAFVGDVAKTVRTAMIGVDLRAEIFSSLVRVGVLPFLTTVLECALRYYEAEPEPSSTESAVPPAQRWVVRPSRAVQLVCDTLYSCASHFPECVEDVVAEAAASPGRCLLQLLLHALTVVRSGAEAQSVVDAVHCCGVGVPITLAMFGDNAQLEGRRHDVLRFWIEGNAVDRPPLFHLSAHLVQLLLGQAATPVAATLTCASGGSAAFAFASPPSLTTVQERQVVYGLRVLTAVIGKVDSSRCHSLVEVLTLSRLMPALATTLTSPQRRLAHLQSCVAAFIAAVLDRRDARLVALVTGDPALSLLHTALRLFLQCSSRHHGNVLTSSLAHLLAAVCEGVHREKLQGSGAHALGPSPFVTLLRGDDSISKTEQVSPTASPPSRPFEAVATALVAEFGERLAEAAPLLHERLRRALEETPEQAQQAEVDTSSLTSSVDRSGLPGFTDFDAAAIDFGLETPLGAPITDSGAEARRQGLTHAGLTPSPHRSDGLDDDEDDEDDPLDCLSSIEADSDNEEEEAPVPLPPTSAPAKSNGQAGSADSPPGAAAPSGSTAAGSSAVSASVPPLPDPLVTAASPSAAPAGVAEVESVDPVVGRGSLLEDEENRVPRRVSIKRGREDKLDEDDEEAEAEAKRRRAEESAA